MIWWAAFICGGAVFAVLIYLVSTLYRIGKIIKYGYRNSLHHKIQHWFTDPVKLIQSYLNNEPSTDTACMLCVKDESKTVKRALESTLGLIDYYIVVDKNGSTIPTIKKFIDEHSLEAEYHIKPELDLRGSRDYALSRLKNTWLLLIDGDEYLTKQGRNKVIENRKHPHTYLRTCKNIIINGDKTKPINNGYHSILYHNNGTIRVPDDYDIPKMSGRAIHLQSPIIFNDHSDKRRGKEIIPYNQLIQGEIPEEIIKQ